MAFGEAIHFHKGGFPLGRHSGLLQVAAQRGRGQHHALLIGGEDAAVKLVDGHCFAGSFDEQRQPAKVVDVAVRDDNAANIRQADGLAKVGPHGFESGEQLSGRFAVAAARIDERRHAGLEHQIGERDQVWKCFAGEPIDSVRCSTPQISARPAAWRASLASVCSQEPISVGAAQRRFGSLREAGTDLFLPPSVENRVDLAHI